MAGKERALHRQPASLSFAPRWLPSTPKRCELCRSDLGQCYDRDLRPFHSSPSSRLLESAASAVGHSKHNCCALCRASTRRARHSNSPCHSIAGRSDADRLRRRRGTASPCRTYPPDHAVQHHGSAGPFASLRSRRRRSPDWSADCQRLKETMLYRIGGAFERAAGWYTRRVPL